MDKDLQTGRGRLRGFSINRLIPNLLTLAALCTGMTALRFALEGQYRNAVIAIVVAAILDTLDGRVARRLGVASRFGAELDSLSDFFCFGVTPALVVYLASLTTAGPLGWVVTLWFPICSALRLARFNTALVSDTLPPPYQSAYFTGVPAPAGALLALVPLLVGFQLDAMWPPHPLLSGFVLAVVGGLMVSRLPTFSFKKGRVPRHFVLPALLGAAVFMGLLATSPWIAMSLLLLAYVSLIPFSVMAHRRQKREYDSQQQSAAVVPLRAVEPGGPGGPGPT